MAIVNKNRSHEKVKINFAQHTSVSKGAIGECIHTKKYYVIKVGPSNKASNSDESCNILLFDEEQSKKLFEELKKFLHSNNEKK